MDKAGPTRTRLASFDTLPLEILDFIAMNLTLIDYLRFCIIHRRTWSLFSYKTLISILKKIEAPGGGDLEKSYEYCQLEECHYLSRDHILSFAYHKRGLTLELDTLIQIGASLKHIPCGDMVGRAARSLNYKKLLSWLIDHGASFGEVQGGIAGLCCEAYEQGDFERFRWLFSNGASLDILAEMVFHFLGCHMPRSREACRSHLIPLKRALREGATPDGSHAVLAAELKRRRHKVPSGGRTMPVS